MCHDVRLLASTLLEALDVLGAGQLQDLQLWGKKGRLMMCGRHRGGAIGFVVAPTPLARHANG